MTLPRRSFLKSIAAALAGATAVRSAVTPVAEAVEPLAEFPRKGLRIHNALLEDNLVDVQHDMMARLGREWAERVNRSIWDQIEREFNVLPAGFQTTSVAGWPVRRIHATVSVNTRDYVKLARASEHFHNIAFGLPHGTTK